jgi:pyrimidine-specific ribonucleoside hydrolase
LNNIEKFINMKNIFFALIAFSQILSSCSSQSADKKIIPVKIIFDTDMGPDYDDVGAIAFLHAMADSGKVDILATVASNKHELVAPSINVLNTYFGRKDLPVGAPKTAGVNIGSSQHWADSIVANYPHALNSTSEVQDAVSVYRQVLSKADDNSVTVVTVGFLTNLNNLLRSEPDKISPLNGKDLVIKKVKRLISMAGKFPEGKEFNVFMDSTASKYVYENWPGEVIFTGFEIGAEIHTGIKLIASNIQRSPVKDVFRISIPLAEEDKNGRMSWDETAVLIGVYGTGGFFDTVRGKIIVNPDGSNTWENSENGKQVYVKQKMSIPEISSFIEARMMHQPVLKR